MKKNLLLIVILSLLGIGFLSAQHIIREEYEIPAAGIYPTWDHQQLFPDELTIPFDAEGKLRIILVEENNPFHAPCRYKKSSVPAGSEKAGVDLKADAHDSVVCCFDGVVRVATTLPHYGKMVVVRHYNGLETFYAQLDTISVQVNQRVAAGDLLGFLASNSNRATLHFEVRFLNYAVTVGDMIDWATGRLRSNVLVITQEQVQGSPQRGSTTSQTAGGSYIVQEGDTLYRIAQKHHISLEQLYRWNNLTEKSILQPGMRLRVAP